MDMILAGMVSALSSLFLLMKLDIRKVLGYDWFADIAFTVALAVLFQGTYSGMTAAMVGGATLSVVLWALKHRIGYKRLLWRDRRLRWVGFVPDAPLEFPFTVKRR